MGDHRINIAVFISGNGSNLQSLIDACDGDNFPARIALVVSNKPEAYGLKRAAAANIPTAIVDHKHYTSREAFDQALLAAVKSYDIDAICLAGFMRILTPVFIDQWARRILNTHPSLLPKHGGAGMYGNHVHKAVLDAQDKESGVSIHIVNEECDAGRILVQKSVPVLDNDTVETLGARVLEMEHIAYPEALERLAKEMRAK